jgi:hypothetical protein
MEPQLNKLDPALDLSTLGCSSTHLFSSLSYSKILFWSHYEKGGLSRHIIFSASFLQNKQYDMSESENAIKINKYI